MSDEDFVCLSNRYKMTAPKYLWMRRGRVGGRSSWHLYQVQRLVWFGGFGLVWWSGPIDAGNIRDGEGGVAGGLSQAQLSNEYGDRLLSSAYNAFTLIFSLSDDINLASFSIFTRNICCFTSQNMLPLALSPFLAFHRCPLFLLFCCFNIVW